MEILKNKDGFTFLEVMVTLIVLTLLVTIFVSASSVMNRSNKKVHIKDMSRDIAAKVSEETQLEPQKFLGKTTRLLFDYHGQAVTSEDQAYFEVIVNSNAVNADTIADKENIMFSSQKYTSLEIDKNFSKYILLYVDEDVLKNQPKNVIRLYKRNKPLDQPAKFETDLLSAVDIMGFKYNESQGEVYAFLKDYINGHTPSKSLVIESENYMSGTNNLLPIKLDGLLDRNSDLHFEVWNFTDEFLQMYYDSSYERGLTFTIKAGKVGKATFDQSHFVASHMIANISCKVIGQDEVLVDRNVSVYTDVLKDD